MVRGTLTGLVVLAMLLGGCLLPSAPDRAPDAAFTGTWTPDGVPWQASHGFVISANSTVVTMCFDADALTNIRYSLGKNQPPTPIYTNFKGSFCKEQRDRDQFASPEWHVRISEADGAGDYQIRVWW